MERQGLDTDLATVLREVRGRWVGADADVPRRAIGGVSTDSRTLAPGDLFCALDGERCDGHDFVGRAIAGGAAACLVSEERAACLSGPLIAVDEPLAALERLAAWRRSSLSVEVTAVTGSVGKTTTKEFLRALLSVRHRVDAAPRSFNNRLGVALTLLAASPSTEHLVVELGTSAPGEISHLSRLVRPDRAVVTRVGPAHLGGLGDIAGVARAKAEVFDGLHAEGIAYLNAELESLEPFAARAPGTIRTFGWQRGDFPVMNCRRRGRGPDAGHSFELGGERLHLSLPGRHNVLNAAAAIAVARDLGVSWDEVRFGLTRCRLPPGRLEVIVAGGISLIDDSYNANPDSVAAAVETLRDVPRSGGRRVAVLGDMLELGDASRSLHQDLGRRLDGAGLDLLLTVGVESRFVSRSLLEARGTERARPDVRHFDDAGDALDCLRAELRPGDTVLLKGSHRSGVRELAAALRKREAERDC